ncbi:MAG: adenylate/guanylate cyclase domain-containing protein [Alphaproteobacteria bacterium]|nr:adenylate/guanylate cyclase domain-containing protein [Alphaproteobacteria bacterium]
MNAQPIVALVKRHLHYLVPILILAVALILPGTRPALVNQLRSIVFDEYQRIKPRAYAQLPVRIVDIDDESLDRLGQWPWPRSLLGELVTKLTAAGAAAIAFDIVFAEPDRSSPRTVLKTLPSSPELDPLKKLADTLPDNDEVLAHAIGDSNVVLGFVLGPTGSERAPAAKFGIAAAGDPPERFVARFDRAILNLPVLEAAAAGNGSFNSAPDEDGAHRRAPVLIGFGDKVYPSLVAELLRVAQGASTYVVKSSGASGETGFGEQTGIASLRVGQVTVPTDGSGNVWLYDSGPIAERFVPAWAVLEGKVPAEKLDGNLVLIGTSAPGLKDQRTTPLNPAGPGIEIHAQLLEQILSEVHLRRPDYADGAERLFILVLGLVLITLLPRWGAIGCAVIALSSVALATGGSWYAFSEQGYLFDPIYPSATVLSIYTAESMLLFFRSESERRTVRAAFTRYMSPALVAQLAQNPERLKLGGEMRDMTLLFCDIRGFTTISEQFDAEGLTHFINKFLTPMTDVILERRGTIDKYMGDAIMAFWNAPLDDAEHATNACRAALAMIADLNRLNQSWRREAEREGRPYRPVDIGVGLNSGICCVGNMGSDQRFDYSVLGDDVNLASRLEGQSKTYSVSIVVGENTRTRVPSFAMLELDLIQVKGKTKPVRIFTLAGDETRANTADFAALKAAHDAMLAAYRAQDWDQADARLGEAQNLVRGRSRGEGRIDGLYDLYAERIADFRANPPGPDWGGVYVALSK